MITPDDKEPVERTADVLGSDGSTILTRTVFWEEVRSCSGTEVCLCADDHGKLPEVFVVRGSQMFKLLWPILPVKNELLVARPDI